jgi:hypothetical protein
MTASRVPEHLSRDPKRRFGLLPVARPALSWVRQ